MTANEMIQAARRYLQPRKLNDTTGDVACSLLSDNGNMYYGVCIDVGSGIGFCAEHSAIAAMVTAGERRISQIVAVWGVKAITVLPPCGRCRELMYQIDERNLDTDIILAETQTVKLRDLLPHCGPEKWNE
ncbi:cytidine deaminase [Candidatus Bipolaricaulota bacterium]